MKDLLEQGQTNIMQVLENQSILQEVKQQSDYIVEYFNFEKLQLLLDLIVCYDKEQKDQNYFKFSQIASEILQSDLPTLADFFQETRPQTEQTYLEYMIHQIEGHSLNDTAVSYIYKILNNLLLKKVNIFLKLILKNQKIMGFLVAHLESKTISSILNICINITQEQYRNQEEELKEEAPGNLGEVLEETLAERAEVFRTLLAILLSTTSREQDQFTHQNIFDIFNFFITKQGEVCNWDYIFNATFGEKEVLGILDLAFGGDNADHVKLVNLVSKIIMKIAHLDHSKEIQSFKDIYVPKIIEIIQGGRLILSNRGRRKITMTDGKEITVLRKEVQRNVTFLEIVIVFANQLVEEVLVEKNVLHEVMNLVVAHPYHCILHKQVSSLLNNFWHIKDLDKLKQNNLKHAD